MVPRLNSMLLIIFFCMNEKLAPEYIGTKRLRVMGILVRSSG